jgi:REP element-mobilizing transposase RayT
VDRQDFLKNLAEACQKADWQIHAYCLMSNHYHLVVETPNAHLVTGMTWLQAAYTIRLNHRHKLIGHVLSGRYNSLLGWKHGDLLCRRKHDPEVQLAFRLRKENHVVGKELLSASILAPQRARKAGQASISRVSLDIPGFGRTNLRLCYACESNIRGGWH